MASLFDGVPFPWILENEDVPDSTARLNRRATLH